MGKSYQYTETVAHDGLVHAVRVSSKSSSVLITCGSDSRAHVWAVSQVNQPIVTLELEDCDAEVATFDATEEHVLLGTSTGTVQLWELREQTLLRQYSARHSACSAIDHHPFGEFFCVGYEDGALILWDVEDDSPVQSYAGHHSRVTAVRFSPDGRWIASACADGIVKLWDLMANKQLHCFEDHSSTVTYLAFSPNDLLLASCSVDGLLHLYDLDTFRLAAAIDANRVDDSQWTPEEPCEAAGVQAITFSHGSSVILAALPTELRAWSVDGEPCEVVSVTDLAWGPVYDMVLSDDVLVAACCDGNRVGVALVDGLTKLLHPARPGQHVRGINTADAGPAAARRMLHDSLAGSAAGSAPSSPRTLPRTPVAAIGRSPLKGPSSEAPSRLRAPSSVSKGTAPSSLRKGALESEGSLLGSSLKGPQKGTPLSVSVDACTSRPEALSSRAAGRRGATDSGLLSSLSGVDSPSAALASLKIDDAAGSLSTGAGSMPRSPSRKGMTERSMQQRQSRGVLDAVFQSEPSEEGTRSPRASHLGASDRMSVNTALLRPAERERSGLSGSSRATEVRPLEEVMPPKLPAKPRTDPDLFSTGSEEDTLSQLDGRKGRSTGASMERLPEGEDPLDRLLEGHPGLPDPALDPAESLASMEEQMLDAAIRKHSAVVTALKNRLTNYETVKLFWSNGDLRGVMTAMKLDLSVAADIMDSFKNSRDFFGLDVSTEAVGLAGELLEGATNDKYIAVGLDVLTTYVRGYGQVIKETCSQEVGALHRDIEAEAYRDQCLACRAALQAVIPQLAHIAQQHEDPNLGRKAQELEDEVLTLTSA